MPSFVREIFGAVLVATLVTAALAASAFLRRRRVAPELTRKAAHLGSCLALLPLSSCVHSTWMFAALAALFCAVVASLRRRKHLGFLDDVGRSALSEYAFVGSVAFLAVCSRGDAYLYRTPLLVLGVSDAVAAVVGQRWGRHRYVIGAGKRSWEGSSAFAASSFVVVFVASIVARGTTLADSTRIALFVAIAAAAVEAMSVGGLDNLGVPIAVFGLLAVGLDAHTSTWLVATLPWVCTWAVLAVALDARGQVPPNVSLPAGLACLAAVLLVHGCWLLCNTLAFVAVAALLAGATPAARIRSMEAR